MPVKLCRRFILILLLPALLPVFGSAGAFDDLAAGYPNAALLPVSAPAAAADESRATSAGHYLSLDGLDLRAVPPAPADGSARDREDFSVLLDWQARRTGEQCAKAKAEMNHSYEVFFGKTDPFSDPTPAPVAAFFRNVGKDSVAAHKYLKEIYRRPRPFVRDARVKPCIPPVKGFAYPSGHAAMSRLFALILSDLEPSRRKDFMARADEAALNRVIGGVHHPTDLAAGKALADALYKSLLKQPAFKADLKELRSLFN
ncbi:MAG: phosphatase PAP2 family protein [Elusimicrobia bacterium]|nr:phosphatase PAP2 family protein [Elusimicrobiota bacterium]